MLQRNIQGMTEELSIHVYTDEGISYKQFLQIIEDLQKAEPRIEYHVHGKINLYAVVKNGTYQMR